MTACKDSQATSGKKAVSATLAGVLAVGLVPAVALADEAVEVTEEDGITELTATIGQEFNGGTISKINLNGTVQTTPSKIEITVGTTGLNVAPTQLTSKTTGATLDLLNADGTLKTDLALLYKGGSITAAGQADCPTDAGNYTVQVTGTGNYAGLTSAPLSFSIVSKSLQGATLYEVKTSDLNDVSDTTFNFTGSAQTFGVALGGAPLDLTPSTGDATVTYRNAAGNAVVAPEDAGSYIAVVSGANDYADSEVQIPFTIGTFNLAAADIKLGAVELTPGGGDAAADVVSINGVPKGTAPASTLIPDLEFSYPVVPTKIGSYTTTVSAVDAEKDNIVGAKTLSYDVVTSTGAVFKYKGAALADTPIDLSAGQSFDLSKLEVFDGTGTQLTSDQYTVTVTDAGGRTASVADLNRAGTWNLTVTVNAAAMNYALGGSETVTVNVSNGTVAEADMFVSYKGVTSDEFDELYTGQNMLADVAVKVVSGDKALVEGVDYKVAYTNSKGEAVTEFVDAGTYKVTITSDTWNIATTSGANVCEFTISPIEIKGADVRPAGIKTIVTQKGDPTASPAVPDTIETGIAYTGSAITPTFEYKTSEEDAEGNPIFATLPADTYEITKIVDAGGTDVDAIVDAGTYTVTLTQNAEQGNYTWAAPINVNVTVIKGGMFLDVPTDAWYAEPISKIAAEDIMNGYAGSKFFGPNDTMIRGMVACSFFNMAGGAERYPNNWENGEGGFVTPFDDVASTMYYAQAIAWAADAKVMNGIGGTNGFDPNGAITREQLVAVICNYAKKSGEDVSADVADLDKFPDAGSVSGWAKDVVAWGVSKGIIGNGGTLNPQGQATRAEVAAMIANYLDL